MICKSCRSEAHAECREIARRAAWLPAESEYEANLAVSERAGGQWCDCAHKPRVSYVTAAANASASASEVLS